MTEICKHASDAIALEGGPPFDEKLRAHADECADCSKLLSSVVAVEAELRGLRHPDVSDEVVEALLARKELRQKPRSAPSRYAAFALAAAAIVAVVSLSLTRQTMRDSVLRDEDATFETPEEGRAPEPSPPPPPPPPPPPAPREQELDLDDAREGFDGRFDAEVPARKDEAVDELKSQEGRASANEPALPDFDYGLLQNEILPLTPPAKKRVDVEPKYPESAKNARIQGTVELVVTVDPEGNVVEARVIRSVPGLDEAALDAVRQWKYVPSEEEAVRRHVVAVPFELEEPEEPDASAAASSFLAERARVEDLTFREATGYWANTYLPGDPAIRVLKRRLDKHAGLAAPHEAARSVAQPFDAPERGALSVFLHADRRGISEPSRLLVQVGLQATPQHGRRRPPMNLAVVLDVSDRHVADARALLESLHEARETGDRFRLIRAGLGEVVAPAAFRYGALTVALETPAPPAAEVTPALRLALERVHAGDDPTRPLGTSLVLLVTDRPDLPDALGRLAHRSAIGGVSVSVVGLGDAIEAGALDRIALAGQGRRYVLERRDEARSIVERELTATSRAVARAVRLRIELAPGVKLVDVVDSEPLDARRTERVREAERSIDLRLARNLGIEADRGEDENGIQIVIPSFYASDSHVLLLDVVASGAGPIAEVTARYKDLAELENSVARASLSLPRSNEAPGPLEVNVLKNYLAARLARTLEEAADRLGAGDSAAAVARLGEARDLLSGLPMFRHDVEIARDVAMLRRYQEHITNAPGLAPYWTDSLRYASVLKRDAATR